MTERPDDVKTQARARMRERLAAHTEERRRRESHRACARLVGLDEFRHAGVVMLYLPMPSEVDTTPIALQCFERGKTVCVPRVDWERGTMHAVSVRTFDDDHMERDQRGVRTPRDGQLIVPSSIDLIVVPGLAFDAAGHRLGRGGGFYDRFLARLDRPATSVGLAFEIQILDEVPVDERDVGVDLVVTSSRVLAARARTRG